MLTKPCDQSGSVQSTIYEVDCHSNTYTYKAPFLGIVGSLLGGSILFGEIKAVYLCGIDNAHYSERQATADCCEDCKREIVAGLCRHRLVLKLLTIVCLWLNLRLWSLLRRLSSGLLTCEILIFHNC